MNRTTGAALLITTLLVSACDPFVPVTDTALVAPDLIQAARQIEVFTLDNPSSLRPKAFLGEVVSYSCKHLLTDPPASRGDALLQLRLEALKLGASAIVEVTFDTRGTDAYGTNCWETVQASGTAVRF